MLAACMAHYASWRRRFGQAADSHSCRDQGKTGGDSARDLSQMIQSQDGPGIIPTFSNPRAVQGSARGQVISLGNTKWAQELLRPVSEIFQPETTPTQQQPSTFIPQAGTLEIGCDATEPKRHGSRVGVESSSGGAAAGSAPGTAHLHDHRVAPAASAGELGTTARSPPSHLSGSSSGRMPLSSQSRRKSSGGPGPHDRVQAAAAALLPSVPSRPPLAYPPPRYDSGIHFRRGLEQALKGNVVLTSDDQLRGARPPQ